MKYLIGIALIITTIFFFTREKSSPISSKPAPPESKHEEKNQVAPTLVPLQTEVIEPKPITQEQLPTKLESESKEIRQEITDVVFNEKHPKFSEVIFSNTYENYQKQQLENVKEEPSKNYRFAKFDRKLDIIWVIDDSGSMQINHQQVSAQIKNFLTYFLEKDVDFKMGIVTTSLETISNGEGLARSDYQRNPTPFIANFQSYLNFSGGGSGEEKGLLAISTFLEGNGNFFIRPNSQVIAIVVSDENDSSFDPTKGEDQLLNTNDFLTSLKENYFKDNEFKIYSIIKFPPSALAGTRYAHASYLTEGIVGNIEGDFHKILLNIGGHVLGLSD